MSASSSAEVAKAVQERCASERLRIYTSDDPVGVELGGALKNVIAIAAGACDGLGFGHNARAAIITRGLAEIVRLAMAKGGNALTLAGLAGLGDLVLTCTGELSRNRTVGVEMGKGRALPEVLAGLGHVAEGVRTTRAPTSWGNVWAWICRSRPRCIGCSTRANLPHKRLLISCRARCAPNFDREAKPLGEPCGVIAARARWPALPPISGTRWVMPFGNSRAPLRRPNPWPRCRGHENLDGVAQKADRAEHDVAGPRLLSGGCSRAVGPQPSAFRGTLALEDQTVRVGDCGPREYRLGHRRNLVGVLVAALDDREGQAVRRKKNVGPLAALFGEPSKSGAECLREELDQEGLGAPELGAAIIRGRGRLRALVRGQACLRRRTRGRSTAPGGPPGGRNTPRAISRKTSLAKGCQNRIARLTL